MRRHIARGHRVVDPPVPIESPAVEFVRRSELQQFVVAQAGAGKAVTLSLAYDIGDALAVNIGLAPQRSDRRRVAGRIDLNAIFARLADCQCEIRCIDFIELIAVHLTHTEIEHSLRELDLGDAIVQVENGGAGRSAHAHPCFSELQLGTRSGVGPDAIAGDEGSVHLSESPFVLACR